jgi:hypothetical protein
MIPEGIVQVEVLSRVSQLETTTPLAPYSIPTPERMSLSRQMFPTEVNADNVTIVLFVKLARVLPSLPQPCGWLGRVAIGA